MSTSFHIFAPLERLLNSEQNPYSIFHLTISVVPHCLEKLKD